MYVVQELYKTGEWDGEPFVIPPDWSHHQGDWYWRPVSEPVRIRTAKDEAARLAKLLGGHFVRVVKSGA